MVCWGVRPTSKSADDGRRLIVEKLKIRHAAAPKRLHGRASYLKTFC